MGFSREVMYNRRFSSGVNSAVLNILQRSLWFEKLYNEKVCNAAS